MIRRPPRSTLFPYTTLFRSYEGDPLAIGRPLKAACVGLQIGQLFGLAAIGADQPEVVLFRPARGKCDPVSVRRPLRVVAGFFAVGELEADRAVRVGHVDVRYHLALLSGHHRLGHGEDDPAPVGGDPHIAYGLHFHHLRRGPSRWLSFRLLRRFLRQRHQARLHGKEHTKERHDPPPMYLLHRHLSPSTRRTAPGRSTYSICRKTYGTMPP